MDADALRDLLERVQRGEVTPEQAAAALQAQEPVGGPAADVEAEPSGATAGSGDADGDGPAVLGAEEPAADDVEDLEEVDLEDLDEGDAARIRERVLHLGPLQGTLRVRQGAGPGGRKTFVVDARRRNGARGRGGVQGRFVWDAEDWESITSALQGRAEDLGRVGEQLGDLGRRRVREGREAREGRREEREGRREEREGRRGARSEPGVTHQVNGPLRRVVVRSAAKRIRVIGDPAVSGVVVTGRHELHVEDGAVTIDATPGSGEGLSPWLGREAVEVRLHPTVPLQAEIDAGDGLVEGVLGPLELAVNAGRARIRGARGPLELQVNAGSLEVEALLTEGHHAIAVNAGRCAIELAEGSSVRIERAVTLGKADVYEEVVGDGRATLDLEVNLGSAWVRPASASEQAAPAEDAGTSPAG